VRDTRSKNFVILRPEVCRSRSTGVDSGRSLRFSAGAGAGPGMDIFDWNEQEWFLSTVVIYWFL